MENHEIFSDLHPVYKGTLFEGDESLCEAAEQFLGISEQLLTQVRSLAAPFNQSKQPAKTDSKEESKQPSQRQLRVALAEIVQCKVQLFDTFFEVRHFAPKSCQYRMRSSTEHSCLFTVLEVTYAAIREVMLPLYWRVEVVKEVSAPVSIPSTTTTINWQF